MYKKLLVGLALIILISGLAVAEFQPYGNINLNNIWNITGINDFNCSGCINPEDVNDIDKSDIEGDINTFVDIDGDIMTGPIDMNRNNIYNVSNYTGDKINVTCCVYLGTIQATDGDSISVQPTDDEDDYFSFKTPAHRPTIKREGGKFIYIESSNVYDVGISARKDDTYSGTLNYEKDNHRMTMLGKNSPLGFKANSEYNNFIEFETYNHQPQISVWNGTILKINDSLEVVGNINATGNLYIDYSCYNSDCSAYTHHNGTHTIRT